MDEMKRMKNGEDANSQKGPTICKRVKEIKLMFPLSIIYKLKLLFCVIVLTYHMNGNFTLFDSY
jgi:hypothetical protein